MHKFTYELEKLTKAKLLKHCEFREQEFKDEINSLIAKLNVAEAALAAHKNYLQFAMESLRVR